MPSVLTGSGCCTIALIAVTSLLGAANSHPVQQSQSAPLNSAIESQDLALYEAEILIYLIPSAREDRRVGRSVTWVLEDSAKLNQRDFFNFWVLGPPNPYGSSTIGYFSVNKHSAEVVDQVLFKRVDDPELKGVQGVLRRAHRIDDQTIKKYQGLTP
jgi:hypothetical protein